MGLDPFLQSVRDVARLRHLSIHTEDAYLQTIRRFIVFHGRRHPAKLGAPLLPAVIPCAFNRLV